ncbi:alpha-1,2-fucosyltransferase [Vibrio parahaemolyticus]|uniref:alpha-1,2-fucosyltransferase n=1 Tax=Vibrio parahaemolyticus TaxID=670 RepID=UPI00084AD605|nr:alpha-1,2-fucosyltransferase [Vibrio parahaemolyticus]EGQ9275372.1 alpha-1,2-fucosyltransferase [Vibrio parahaemolyticus]EGQ9712190.1 alpha-1,2-fucosyltransferase [Vibrio parahaemolyticus]EIA0900827.1 alpha-1,2-fucosyltransferase [Vibrio parahaemolyticus]EIK4818760.1 alpha-1,2-fucosyltransferase [Vibrio parahaemolyticus]MBE4516027.1 alpha-1,2-fucosyltransferase [Vibrio parahaemolyticus]
MICFPLFGGYGRNGNMLFQYASGMSFAINNKTKFFVPSWIGNEILSLDKKNYTEYPFPRPILNSRFFRAILYKLPLTHRYDGNSNKIAPIKNNFLNIGYYQSLKYFEMNVDYIKQCLKPSKQFEQVLSKYDHILSNVVAMHVRRGDYIESDLYPVCSIDYYIEAMKKFPNDKFMVFTDDVDWAKKKFSDRNDLVFSSDIISYGEHSLGFLSKKYHSEFDSWLDLYLMTRAKGNIISNSTFSWWAGFLNNGRVICPSNWINEELLDGSFESRNLLPKSWEYL